MTKPRLLILYPTLAVDGDFIPRTYQLLADRYEIAFITPSRVGYPDFGLAEKTLDLSERTKSYPDVRVIPLPLVHSTHRILRTLYSPLALARTFREFRPDIVHVYSEVFSPTLSQAIITARLCRNKAKFVNYSCENIDWYRFPFSAVGKWNLNHLAAAYTLNRDAEQEIAKFGKPKKLFRFGLGCDIDPIIFRQRTLSGKPVTIGFIGRMIHEKGLDTLLKATKLLRREDIRLLIAGEWPEWENFKTLAKDLGVSAQFLGRISPDQIGENFYRKIDLLVVPSKSAPHWREQFGRVIIEGMAAGVPIVGSNSGAIPEVIDEYGMIFYEGDETNLAEKISDMLSDAERYADYSREGEKYARKNFSLGAFSEHLDSMYRAILR